MMLVENVLINYLTVKRLNNVAYAYSKDTFMCLKNKELQKSIQF